MSLNLRDKISVYQSNLYGIEIQNVHEIDCKAKSTNRTFMELKCCFMGVAFGDFFCTNRTFMELKCILRVKFRYPLLYQSNLYGIEILVNPAAHHLVNPYQSNLYGIEMGYAPQYPNILYVVPIEPLWN